MADISLIKVEKSHNIGDAIQTIAAKLAIESLTKKSWDGEYVEREALDNTLNNGPLLLSGWYMEGDNWPPSEGVDPLLFSFHINPKAHAVMSKPESVAYFKRHQPIGCRDLGTKLFLEALGVRAFLSRCLTLTLPERSDERDADTVFAVGLGEQKKMLIKTLQTRPVFIEQDVKALGEAVSVEPFPCELGFEVADYMLDLYKRRAKLVITSKIHCAMPCIAMGIPTVFVIDERKVDDYRLAIVKGLLPIVRFKTTKIPLLGKKIYSWVDEPKLDPGRPNISIIKSEVLAKFRAALEAKQWL